MKSKYLVGVALLLMICFMVTVCSAAAPKGAKPKAERVFTLAELAKYDGKDGRPAYVAVDGIVYDETGVWAWGWGEHNGGKAGTDISALIRKSPHGLKVLKDRPIVGRLAKPVPVKPARK